MADTLILIQHCQSQHHINRQADLWPDGRNGLTSLGRQQAALTAERVLQGLSGQASRLYSSDMQRARETAQIVAAALGVEPVTVPQFREWNGRFAVERDGLGMPWPDYDGSVPLLDWRPIANAESWREFYGRVSAGIERILSQHDPQRLPVFVLHGGSVSNMVAWWLGLPVDALPDRSPFVTSPGAISLLKRNRYGKPMIGFLNDRAHLRQAGLDDGRWK